MSSLLGLLAKIKCSFIVSLFSFCFDDLSIGESGVLKSPTIIVWGSMCVLSFSKVSFMNVDALAFEHENITEMEMERSLRKIRSSVCTQTSCLDKSI